MDTRADLARTYVATLDARDWDSWAELLSPDVVYEIPQSRERIRGRDGLLAFSVAYPGDWHLSTKLVVADAERAVIWMEQRTGEEPDGDAQVFLEFDDAGRVSRITDFWPEPYDPPQRPGGPLERY